MRMQAAIGLLTGMLLAVAGAAAQQDFVDAEALGKADLARYWQLRLPLAPEQQIADVYLVDDNLYATTRDGYVFALHAGTGAVRWVQLVTTGGYRLERPAHSLDRTVFVTPPEVMTFGRYFGDPHDRFELRHPAGSPPASDGVRFFLGGINQRIHAFFVTTGFEAWKAVTNGQVVARPVVFDDRLYFASDRGTVYAVRAANKRLDWAQRTQGFVRGDIAVDRNGVYVPSLDQSLYLFELTTGGLRWRARLSSPLEEPPMLTESTAYQYSDRDGIAAINVESTADPRIRWRVRSGRRALTVHDGFLYAQSQTRTLLVIDIESGTVAHEIATPGFTIAVPSPDNQTIYLAAPDGRIYCARPRGLPPLQAEDVRLALQRREQQQQPEAPADVAPTPAERELTETLELLESRRRLPPVGGKSKVTRELIERRNQQNSEQP